eukprot:870661-Rhodomonas_salina.1
MVARAHAHGGSEGGGAVSARGRGGGGAGRDRGGAGRDRGGAVRFADGASPCSALSTPQPARRRLQAQRTSGTLR